MFVCPSVCLSVSLCQSVSQSVCQSVSQSVCLSVSLCVCLSVCHNPEDSLTFYPYAKTCYKPRSAYLLYPKGSKLIQSDALNFKPNTFITNASHFCGSDWTSKKPRQQTRHTNETMSPPTPQTPQPQTLSPWSAVVGLRDVGLGFRGKYSV